MKASYYPETDSLYLELSDREAADSEVMGERIVVDFAADGSLVGFDVQHGRDLLEKLAAEGLIEESPVNNGEPGESLLRTDSRERVLELVLESLRQPAAS